MQKQTKIVLGLAVVLFVVGAVFLSVNTELLEGRIGGATGGDKYVSLSCSNTWEKALTGKYEFVIDPVVSSDTIKLDGITHKQLDALANSIQLNGCDMKLVFRTSDDAFKEPVVLCDQYHVMGGLSEGGLYVGCSTTAPMVSNNNYDKDAEFLYDYVTFVASDYIGVGIMKGRVNHWLSDWAPTVTGFFTGNNYGEYEGSWYVDIYLKK